MAQCKESTYSQCRRKWQPTPVFLPGESCGQRSLAGYIVHGVSKESDMTERLNTRTHAEREHRCSVYIMPKSLLSKINVAASFTKENHRLPRDCHHNQDSEAQVFLCSRSLPPALPHLSPNPQATTDLLSNYTLVCIL